ncbi:hypothetical protein Q7P36_002887 [Cladosporium allicinum]
MEARPAGTANLARTGRTSEGRCGGAIARIEMYMYSAVAARKEQSPSSSSSNKQLIPSAQTPISEPSQVFLAHLTIPRRNPNTITMHSMEIKNWITALVVGILGLLLAAFGVVLAYKQLKRTKRLDDVEVARPESIAPREEAVGIELAEYLRATGDDPVETSDGATN